MILKTSGEIEIMAEGGRLLAAVLRALQKEVRVGLATRGLDRRARELIRETGAKPAFLGYRPAGSKAPYGYALCTSVGSTVVHGLPSDYALEDGDILKLDLGLLYKGFYLDSAVTVAVGNADATAKKLTKVTREALERGIREARPGKTLGDIGWAIASHIKRKRFSIVDVLTGHGIGRNLHEDPAVLNWGRPGEGQKLEAGMVLAIEPMVAVGRGAVTQHDDGSFRTADGSLAAHFEHTVAVTARGPRVLTAL